MDSAMNINGNAPSKKRGILIVAIALILVVCVAIFFLWPRGYISVKLLELFGEVTYDRDGVFDIPVYDDLTLTTGDTMKTGGDESFARLSLDSTKVVYMEENSKVNFDIAKASGGSRITLNLEYGAIVNEIEKPLGENESYEVKTPNALMAVRGTRFRVSAYYDEDGILYTRISGLEGKVECKKILPDGTVDSDTVVLTESGKEAIIYYDGTINETDFVYFDEVGNPLPHGEKGEILRNLDMTDLPVQVLHYFATRMDEGVVYDGFSVASLEAAIKESTSNYVGETVFSGHQPVLPGNDTGSENTLVAETNTRDGNTGETNTEPNGADNTANENSVNINIQNSDNSPSRPAVNPNTTDNQTPVNEMENTLEDTSENKPETPEAVKPEDTKDSENEEDIQEPEEDTEETEETEENKETEETKENTNNQNANINNYMPDDYYPTDTNGADFNNGNMGSGGGNQGPTVNVVPGTPYDNVNNVSNATINLTEGNTSGALMNNEATISNSTINMSNAATLNNGRGGTITGSTIVVNGDATINNNASSSFTNTNINLHSDNSDEHATLTLNGNFEGVDITTSGQGKPSIFVDGNNNGTTVKSISLQYDEKTGINANISGNLYAKEVYVNSNPVTRTDVDNGTYSGSITYSEDHSAYNIRSVY